MNALEARGLGRRYGRRHALRDCTLSLPAGRVIGLIGPNGAGKSTLLGLAAGMITPTSGWLTVCGERPAAGAAQLARVGFLAQDAPLYRGLTIADHNRLGGRVNRVWDGTLIPERAAALGLDPGQRAGTLSGGQRAQLALAFAAAKRPDLLLLDEPVASLDPLARRQFLQALMEFVADRGATVIVSSHLVAELERVCDHVVVMTAGRVQLDGATDELIESHVRAAGPVTVTDPATALGAEVVHGTRSGRRQVLVARSTVPIVRGGWETSPLTLEEIALAYMQRGDGSASAVAGGESQVLAA